MGLFAARRDDGAGDARASCAPRPGGRGCRRGPLRPSLLTTSAAVGPAGDMRMSSGPSPWNEKPRSGSSSCIEETPMSSTTPSTGAKPCVAAIAIQFAEAAFDERQPVAEFVLRARCRRRMAAGSRSMASTRAVGALRGWRACSRRRRTCRQCRCRRPAARALSQHLRKQHGNVARRSLCGRPWPWPVRAAPSFPCSSLAASSPEERRPAPNKLAMSLDLFAGARAPLFEARGLPHLEFVAQGRQK